MKTILLTLITLLISSSFFAQCTNPYEYGNGVLTATTGSSDIISCQFAEEYGVWDGVIAGNSYTTSSDIITDFVTVRSGSATGPVVAFGVQPLVWVATTTGTHYIHINTNASCGVASDCRDIETVNDGPAFACSNPAIGGSTNASVITACPGQSFSLYLTGASSGSDLTYQWQSSADGITYTDILGATSSSYSATQTTLTYYQCLVICSGGTPATSTPLMVDMGDCVIMGNGSVVTCSGNFYDSGGGSGNYLDNENYTMTITPATPGAFLQVNFTTFNVEPFWELMTVYNGNSVAAPLLGSFDTNPGSITSTAVDGSLTFVFTSDGSVNYEGWVATIACVTPPINDLACSAINLPVDGSVLISNNGGASTEPGENLIAPPTTGYNTTDGWGESTLSFTSWFTFTAPASGNVKISCTDVEFDGQVAVYSVTDCGDFSTYTLVAANDDAMDFSSQAPEFTICGLNPTETYYLLFDSGSTFSSGQFSISISNLSVTAGTFTDTLDVCSGATVDLFDGLSGNDLGGTWYEMIPTVGLSGSNFNTTGLAYQVFDFEYEVIDGCATDISMVQVHVFGPSNAGNDGILDVCRNETYNLLDGLSGNVDLGGTWYDPSNQPIVGNTVTAGNIPGQFNYDYITGNGVCPDDTANVLVNVANCTTGINDLLLSGILIYPNPTNGILFISNDGSSELFNYEILNIEGRIIAKENAVINGTSATEINLTGMVTGMYMIRIFNENMEGTYRVILQ